MAIDVNTIVTDNAFDAWLGGQVNGATTLRPASWTSSLPARKYALDETLRLFSQARPAIDESLVTDATILIRAILLGSTARLYELAMTQAPEPGLFFHLEKRYRGMFEAEVSRLIGVINANRDRDLRGRSRRVVTIGRR